MADGDVPPPPPGFLPGPPPPPPPEGFVAGYPPQQPWQGSIVPWRTDASGQRIFDPLNAGITGSALDAFMLPGDILTGKQPTPYTGGNAQADPALLQRTENLATFISPTSAASRTGAMVPGGFYSREVPTSDQLLAAGPQRGPGGQFLPGGPTPFADPRNLAAAQRSDAITSLANPPLTGPKVPAREQVASFIKDPANRKGFTQDEISALDDFAKGGTWTGKIGNLLEGKVGQALAAVGGGLLGLKHGDLGGVVGATVAPLVSEAVKPLVGWPFRAYENARASSQLDAISQQLRSRSPLGEQYLNQNVRVPNTLLNQALTPFLSQALVSPLSLPPQQSQPTAAPQGGAWDPQRGPTRFAPPPPTIPTPNTIPSYAPANPNEPGPPRPTGEYFNPYGGSGPIPFGARPIPPGLLYNWA